MVRESSRAYLHDLAASALLTCREKIPFEICMAPIAPPTNKPDDHQSGRQALGSVVEVDGTCYVVSSATKPNLMRMQHDRPAIVAVVV